MEVTKLVTSVVITQLKVALCFVNKVVNNSLDQLNRFLFWFLLLDLIDRAPTKSFDGRLLKGGRRGNFLITFFWKICLVSILLLVTIPVF